MKDGFQECTRNHGDNTGWPGGQPQTGGGLPQCAQHGKDVATCWVQPPDAENRTSGGVGG